MTSPRVIALIPARKGSQGIPNKNLQVIGGKPLLGWTIEAALGAKTVDEVWLSSDSQEMLQYGENHRVSAHTRTDFASSNSATASDVVFDFLKTAAVQLNPENTFLVYLQPTSPFRTSSHIDQAISIAIDSKPWSCVAVKDSSEYPAKVLRLDDRGLIQGFFDETSPGINRQELAPTFYPNGSIYVFKIQDFLLKGQIPVIGSSPFLMSKIDSIDIDTSEDLIIARGVVEYGKF